MSALPVPSQSQLHALEKASNTIPAKSPGSQTFETGPIADVSSY